jgi:hypothetical protein
MPAKDNAHRINGPFVVVGFVLALAVYLGALFYPNSYLLYRHLPSPLPELVLPYTAALTVGWIVWGVLRAQRHARLWGGAAAAVAAALMALTPQVLPNL